jgi:hypothetical protein
MDQIDKQLEIQEGLPVENFGYDLENMLLSELEVLIKDLNYLCLEFDPFNPQFTEKTKRLIQRFNLEDALENPFTFSNSILRVLDRVENRIKALKV